jgi:hypothetical protein
MRKQLSYRSLQEHQALHVEHSSITGQTKHP